MFSMPPHPARSVPLCTDEHSTNGQTTHGQTVQRHPVQSDPVVPVPLDLIRVTPLATSSDASSADVHGVSSTAAGSSVAEPGATDPCAADSDSPLQAELYRPEASAVATPHPTGSSPAETTGPATIEHLHDALDLIVRGALRALAATEIPLDESSLPTHLAPSFGHSTNPLPAPFVINPLVTT